MNQHQAFLKIARAAAAIHVLLLGLRERGVVRRESNGDDLIAVLDAEGGPSLVIPRGLEQDDAVIALLRPEPRGESRAKQNLSRRFGIRRRPQRRLKAFVADMQ